jgi:very-short-patch-repair endonuclease
LYDVGIRAIPQYEVDQYILDFALFADNGRRLDIEVDGERYHRDWDGELVRRDQIRNMRLTEMGWDIMRMWVYEIRDREADVVRRISSWLSENRSDTSEEPNDHGGLDTEGRLSTVKKPLRQRKKSIK